MAEDHGHLRKIGFTIVGEGDTVRILPLDCEMMSAVRRNSLGSLATADDPPLEAWTCDLCSYENGDANSNTCSVCGSSRCAGEEEREEKPNPSPEESVPVSSIHSEALFENVSKETNRRPSLASQPSTQSKLNIELEPLSEDKKHEKIQVDTSKKSETRRVSINFEEMMTMSFANWSVSDNGPWTCANCTYLNQDPLHLTCEVCGHARSKSNDCTSHQSMTDFFNASVLGGETTLLQNRKKVISDLGDKSVMRERMDELVEDQFKIISELRNGNQDSKTVRGTGCQEEAKHLLKELQEKISCMNELLKQEQMEQELAGQAQRQKNSVLKRHEGLSSLDNCSSRDTSTETMVLRAQQRMLDDWKKNSEARDQQLEYVRIQQASLLERYQYF